MIASETMGKVSGEEMIEGMKVSVRVRNLYNAFRR
jgi:hypothetical protein